MGYGVTGGPQIRPASCTDIHTQTVNYNVVDGLLIFHLNLWGSVTLDSTFVSCGYRWLSLTLRQSTCHINITVFSDLSPYYLIGRY